MQLTVSSKNEFEIIPDIAGNLELKEEEQFKIIFKKLSSMESNQWSSIDTETQEISVNFKERLKNAIVRLVNPPTLKVDGEKEEDLTIDILLSDKYTELFDLQGFIITEMQRISDETEIDVKK